jgi:rod shape-determining protein MreB
MFLGEEKTVVAKRGQGIVFNEPSVIAYRDGKIIDVGKMALKHLNLDNAEFKPLVKDFRIANIRDAQYYIKNIVVKTGVNKCLVCIPSSISAEALDDYKTAIYGAGVHEIMFIPAVITNAFAHGYEILRSDPVLSVVVHGDGADICVIDHGEIISGGTTGDLKLLDDAIVETLNGVNLREYRGDHISVINGAGIMLSKDERLIKKILALN